MGLEIIITLAIALGLPGAAMTAVAVSAWRERQPKALSWKERRAVAATKRTQKKQAKLKAIEDARKAQQAEIEAAREESAREIREMIEANRPKALLAAWDEEFKALSEPELEPEPVGDFESDWDRQLQGVVKMLDEYRAEREALENRNVRKLANGNVEVFNEKTGEWYRPLTHRVTGSGYIEPYAPYVENTFKKPTSKRRPEYPHRPGMKDCRCFYCTELVPSVSSKRS